MCQLLIMILEYMKSDSAVHLVVNFSHSLDVLWSWLYNAVDQDVISHSLHV